MKKYIDLGSRAIDPNALIKMANEGAKEQADSESLEDKKATEKVAAESKKAEDEKLPDRTKTAKDNIKKLLADDSPIVEKKAEKTDDVELGSAASVIKLQMGTEAVNDKVAEELNKEQEPIFKVAKGLASVDRQKIVEKIAMAGKAVKVVKKSGPGIAKLLTLGLGSAAAGAGAGYAGGTRQADKRFKRYVVADRRRDIDITRKAYRYGQLNAYNRMKNRLGQAQGAT